MKLLEDLLVGLLPAGPQLYPDGDLSDAPEEAIVAELIREAALEGVRDELPALDRRGGRGDGPARGPARGQAAARHPRQPLRRAVLPEGDRDRPPRAPACARSAPPPGTQIEAMLGTPVYLDLHVKVAKDWQKDPRQLRRLGVLSWLTGRSGPSR